MTSSANDGGKDDARRTPRAKETFLYSKIVPVALAVLLVGLLGVLVIVGLSLIGVINAG